ncbi:MAG: large subunit ribosomal protein [Bacteroidota bacterium]|nr:large subunit ribosomal protein [Bacteroidota bacterium]
MNILKVKKRRIERRKKHVRKSLTGSTDRLRLSIYKSLNHIYAQVISDIEGRTIVSASTIDKEVRPQILPGMKKSEHAKLVGKILAQRAIAAEIQKVTFDRNGFLYHGRVKALAEGAREGGLVF